MWLLKSSSAKKINKSFNHKGPIHSLSLCSVFLSLSPSPLYLSLVVLLSSPDLYFFINVPALKTSSLNINLFFLLSTHPRPSFWFDRKTRAAVRQTDRHHLTSRGHTDRQKHKQGPPYSTNIQSWSRAGEHDMENVFITPSAAQNTNRVAGKLFPAATQTLCAVTNTLAAPFTVLQCVFLCIRVGWCEKASPVTVLFSRVSAAHSWVWLGYH